MRDEIHQNGLTRASTTEYMEYVGWDRFDAEQGGEAEAAEQARSRAAASRVARSEKG